MYILKLKFLIFLIFSISYAQEISFYQIIQQNNLKNYCVQFETEDQINAIPVSNFVLDRLEIKDSDDIKKNQLFELLHIITLLSYSEDFKSYLLSDKYFKKDDYIQRLLKRFLGLKKRILIFWKYESVSNLYERLHGEFLKLNYTNIKKISKIQDHVLVNLRKEEFVSEIPSLLEYVYSFLDSQNYDAIYSILGNSFETAHKQILLKEINKESYDKEALNLNKDEKIENIKLIDDKTIMSNSDKYNYGFLFILFILIYFLRDVIKNCFYNILKKIA